MCVVAMKRTIELCFCILLTSLPSLAYGQVVPAAVGHEPTLTVGGFGSLFQPDYAGNGVAQSSPNRCLVSAPTSTSRSIAGWWLKAKAAGIASTSTSASARIAT